MTMDYERFNPCSKEWYVRAVEWAETGCWCCTATRALLVGGFVGLVLGLLLGGSARASALVLIVGAPIVIAALMVARRVWKDSYSADEGEEKPK